jgi:ubiquitin-like modifier-activating enzyme ATG7
VDEHDAIFLLTDTRESRWLPTLLAAAAGKVAITAALGFDTFLVMRHGQPAHPQAAGAGDGASSSTLSSSSSQQLGCYFCNDVVAPLNSTTDRTLDQQCTVARPGLAPIAGSLAVELMAALLQHPLRGAAPPPAAEGRSSSVERGGALGPVPHMVRGQLSGFGQVCMVGQAFSQCTACSPAVLQQYAAEGWGFVSCVLHNPGLLEELTGLAELHRQAAALDLESGSDDDSDAGGAAAPRQAGEGEWTEL